MDFQLIFPNNESEISPCLTIIDFIGTFKKKCVVMQEPTRNWNAPDTYRYILNKPKPKPGTI